MIEAKNLRKIYHHRAVVDDVSFEVNDGRVTGFLGPNGAGKSTTMRLMLGLSNGQGQVTYNGKLLSKYADASKVVGFLLEAKSFHPTRSARNHLRVIADQSGIPHKRVDEALDLVGLLAQAKNHPGKFSLGMSQRLGIAAAILGEPKYLILDEPANGLDPEGVVWLRKFLKDYVRNERAVFISSHLLSEVQLLADDVVVIGKGKLLADTTVKKLVASGSGALVFVKSPKMADLKRLLKAKKLSFNEDDEGLLVDGSSAVEIGKLAFDSKLPLSELSPRSSSLEDIFLKLTETSEEFSGKVQKRRGKR